MTEEGWPRARAKSSLMVLRELRVVLVDRLEAHINLLVEQLLEQGVFTRDDREEILIEGGPRARVRKALDIVDCKGEEVASNFLSACNRLQEISKSGQTACDLQSDYYSVIKKHKQTVKRRSECMLYYNTRHGEKVLFSEHYVNLLLVKGHRNLEHKKHEFLAFGQNRIALQQHTAGQKVIKTAQLFSEATGGRPAKKILATGVAGIGKTVLVQKILYDFGNNQEHLAFDFVIHLTFRDLNLISKPVSLREMILRKNGHLAKQIDNIFSNDDKLLIVLDGFDEFKNYRECDIDEFLTEQDQEGEVVQVFVSLMQGELLPRASVFLTSRPTAVSYIPLGCIDCFVLITGFSMEEIMDFFLKYFQEDDLALQMFEVVKANYLMMTLCYIPAFCYIVCSILKDSHGSSRECPKTMTDVYTQYLVALLRSHTQGRTGVPYGQCNPKNQEQLSETVLVLGRLAYMKLLEHKTLFYGDSPEIQQLSGCSLVSAFLDKTSVQEPGCTEDVFSFTHLTVQEFFAALYYVLEGQPSPDILDPKAGHGLETTMGYLDLFKRFLSGLLSERNQNLLSRHLQFGRTDKVETYMPKLLEGIQGLCESGAHILNHLHCFFEQQDSSLAQQLHPEVLRVNLSDETLSPMDYTVLKYFLNLVDGKLSELDLTGTNITAESLRDLKPYLLRCEKIWLGENNLDIEAAQVLAEILQSKSFMVDLGLGWTNIGDEELLVLAEGIRTNNTLQELWIEGNRITYRGLSAFTDFPQSLPLHRIVAVGNDVSEEEAETLNRVSHKVRFIVGFTNEGMWEGWDSWVLHRCEVSSDINLVSVLHKICNISIRSSGILWLQTFHLNLMHLIRSRIDLCTEEDVKCKLVKFEKMLAM